MIVFAFGQVLPGDVARKILGPLADPRAVAVLNHQLGTDRPMFTQYWDWVTSFVRGDMGVSYTYREPIQPFVWDALVNSLKLALVAFVFVVPLSIFGGVLAALHFGRPLDRVISVGGLSATVVPEFVSGIVLIVVFGVWLRRAADHGHVATRQRPARPVRAPDHAGDRAHPGALRLHRAHGARRHRGRARRRLHANRAS